MTTMLVLNIPPELEEDMVDYLLSLEAVTGFTSYAVRGHGDAAHLSVAEQVSGRRKRLQFELMLADSAVSAVLQNLGTEVGRDITYWQLPVTNSGRIG